MSYNVSLGYHTTMDAVIGTAVRDMPLRYHAYDSRRASPYTESVIPDIGGDLLGVSLPSSHTGISFAVELPNCKAVDTIAKVEYDKDGSVRVAVYSATHSRAEEEAARIWGILGAEETNVEGSVEFSFWAASQHGGYSYSRELMCPSWEDVKQNYNADVSGALETLMQWPDKVTSGLLLWTGEPGTGKTTAIRALAREWSHWCDIEVVSDPEALLGNMSYLNSLLMNSDSFNFGIGGESTPKSRLVILEDAGELISKDAALRTGTGPLSRLLNVTDGLLGQGTNLKVLITTNEEIGKLHEAVTRNGRCLSDIEFSPLTIPETEEWLKRHKVEHEVTRGLTVADLYGLLHNNELSAVSARKDAGFGFLT